MVEDFYATVVPSLKIFVEKFRAGLNKSVRKAFSARWNGFQTLVETVVVEIKLLFSKDAAPDDFSDPTKNKRNVASQADLQVIELYLLFPFLPRLVNSDCYFWFYSCYYA